MRVGLLETGVGAIFVVVTSPRSVHKFSISSQYGAL